MYLQMATWLIKRAASHLERQKPLSKSKKLDWAFRVLEKSTFKTYRLPWNSLKILALLGDLALFQKAFRIFTQHPMVWELGDVLSDLSDEKLLWLQNKTSFQPDLKFLNIPSKKTSLPLYARLSQQNQFNPLLKRLCNLPEVDLYYTAILLNEPSTELIVWLLDHATPLNLKTILQASSLPKWVTCFCPYGKLEKNENKAQTPPQYLAQKIVDLTHSSKTAITLETRIQIDVLWERLGVLIDEGCSLNANIWSDITQSVPLLLQNANIEIPFWIDEKIQIQQSKKDHIKKFMQFLMKTPNLKASQCRPYLNGFCQWGSWCDEYEQETLLEVWFKRLGFQLEEHSWEIQEILEFKKAILGQIPSNERPVLLQRLLFKTQDKVTIDWLLEKNAQVNKEVIKYWSKSPQTALRTFSYLPTLPLNGLPREHPYSGELDSLWGLDFVASAEFCIWEHLEQLGWDATLEGIEGSLLKEMFAIHHLTPLFYDMTEQLVPEKLAQHETKMQYLLKRNWSDLAWHELFKTMSEHLSDSQWSETSLRDYVETWKITLEKKRLQVMCSEKEEEGVKPSSSLARKRL